MSDIDELVEQIRKRLQRDGVSAVMDEVKAVAQEVSELQALIGNLDSSGDYDNVMPVRNTVVAAQQGLFAAERLVGPPESVLNDTINRIRNA